MAKEHNDDRIVPLFRPKESGNDFDIDLELGPHVRAALERGRQELRAQIAAHIAPAFGLTHAHMICEPDHNGQLLHVMLDSQTGERIREWSDLEWQQILDEWSRRARSGLKNPKAF